MFRFRVIRFFEFFVSSCCHMATMGKIGEYSNRSAEIWCSNLSLDCFRFFVKNYVVFYLVLLKFEMAEKFNIFEAISHILFPDGKEYDFEDGGEEEAEVLQLTEFEYICFFN